MAQKLSTTVLLLIVLTTICSATLSAAVPTVGSCPNSLCIDSGCASIVPKQSRRMLLGFISSTGSARSTKLNRGLRQAYTMTFAMPAGKVTSITGNPTQGDIFKKDVAVALAPQVAAIASRVSLSGTIDIEKVQVLSPLTAVPTGIGANGAVEAMVHIYPLNPGECSEVRGIYETFTLASGPVANLFLPDFIVSYNISSVGLKPSNENTKDLDYCNNKGGVFNFGGSTLALRLGIGIPAAVIFLGIMLFRIYRVVQARRAAGTAGPSMQLTTAPAAGGADNGSTPYPSATAGGTSPAMGYPSNYPSAYPPVSGEYPVPSYAVAGGYPQSGGYDYGQGNSSSGAPGAYQGGFTYSANAADGASNSPHGAVTVSAGPVLYSKYNK